MKKYVLLIVLAFPGVCAATSSWSGYGKITGVMYYEDGSVHVWADMSRYDPASCGNDRYIVTTTNAIKKETYSAALTAYAASKNVRFFVDDQLCTRGNPTLNVIELK